MVLGHFEQQLREMTGHKDLTLELESWSPGDGITRYRVHAWRGDTNEGEPLGHAYILGASACLDALSQATHLLRSVSRWRSH